MCVSTVKRTIPYDPNPTQDSHIPSFVPEMVDYENNLDNEVVLSVSTLSAPLVPVNNDRRVECPYSFYNELGLEDIHLEEFRACFGEIVEENLDNTEVEEKLSDDDNDNSNYDHLSQLRGMNICKEA